MKVHRLPGMILLCLYYFNLHATPGHRSDYPLASIRFAPIHYLFSNQSFYLDAVNGNDANDGLSKQTPVKTVMRLLSLSVKSGDTIFVARGSRFREFLNIKDLQVSNITVMDYGNGPRPVFDAADSAQNNLFTKKAGYQNLYDIAWKNNFRDITDVSQYSVWEDGWRLKRTASLQQCENTPGSYYAPVVTQPAGTDNITIHARNSDAISSNNRLYEITRRSMGIHVGDNSRVYNMHTRRNGSNNGSFEAGNGCYIFGVLAEDGVKHNFFMGSGTAEKCMAWKSDDPVVFGGNTLFISFTTSTFADTMDVLYKNCIAIAGRNTTDQFQYGAIGLYEHTTGVPYRSFKVKGGVFANTSVGVSAELKDIFIDSVFFINNTIASSKIGGSITLKNSNIILTTGDAAAISSDNALDSIVFVNNKVYMPGAGQMVAKLPLGAPQLTRVTDNTVVCDCENNFNVVYFNSGGGKLIMERNLAANLNSGPIIGFATLDPFSKTNIQSDNNHYGTQLDNGLPLKILWTGPTVNYTNLDQIKAAGYESGSSGEPSSMLQSRMNGTYGSTDFFLSKNDVLYNKCGSSSTFDEIARYPSWLGDTLGFVLKENAALIKFISFSGTILNLGNQLTWQVTQNDQLLYFEVEFSTDGVNFSTLGKIQYDPDKQKYQYLHAPAPAANCYYRISATSENGSKIYSEQLLLRTNIIEKVQVGPNPANQLLHVTVDLPAAGKINIRILGVDGKTVNVLQKQLTVGNQSLDLNLSGLMAGLYYVEVNTTKKYIFKVVKR